MKIGIIGTGLIGGSLALALAGNKKYQIYCWNRNPENSKKTIKKTKIAGDFETIEELTEECDVIIIATPLASYGEITKKIAKKITSCKIISDIGSVKYEPIKLALKNLPKKYHKNFVPAHPIAGSEKAGIEAAKEDLFLNKKFIITKTSNCNRAKTIAKIWHDAGCKIEFLSQKKHDEIYAYVSHYVQFLSFKLEKHFPKNMGEFSRLMHSPKEIWQEIFKFNSANLKKINKAYIKQLKAELKNINDISGAEESQIMAKFLVENYVDITPNNYLNYSGTGYKSFTSVMLQSNKKNIEASNELKKNINKIIHELEKTKF
jgi:prephenate dehydrogenase